MSPTTGALATRRGWWILASIASGCLVAASLPPSDHGLLAFVAFVPALVSLRRTSYSRALASATLILGTLFLWAFWGGWPQDSVGSRETLRVLLGFGVLIALPFSLYARVRKWSPLTVWALTAVAVLWEALASQYLPATLAWTQHRSPGMLYLASATGWWGVVAAIWATNLFLARVFFLAPTRRALPSVLACALTLVGAALAFPPSPRSETALQVIVVQTATLSPSHIAQLVGDRQTELLILPRIELTLDEAEALASAAHAPSVVLTREGWSGIWNPSEPNAMANRTTIRGVPVYVPQTLKAPLVHDLRALGSQVSLAAIPRATAESPYQALAAWDAAGLTLASASLGQSVARADTAGFSRVTGPTGEVLSDIPRRQRDAIGSAAVPASPTQTLYSQFGDWPLIVVFAILLLWILVWGLQRLGILVAGREAEAPLRILPRVERENYSRN